MEKPIKIQSLDQNRDEKGKTEYPKSPEFEFWMVRNPSIPQPNILTADQLFSDGVLLPLHTLPVSSTSSESVVDESELVSVGPELTMAVVSEPATGSRRWKDIFKKSDTKSNATKETTTTDQKLESPKASNRKTRGGGGIQTSSAELNINIWPFSRSRSAKTGSTRPKVATGGRKVSSAPCSRSNSGSESKSRKWPASPARGGGVHVGRSSPVWQARRGGGSAAVSRLSAGGGKGKSTEGCNGEGAAVNGGDIVGGGCGRMSSGGSHDESGVVNLFNFRSLFSKRVH